MKSQHDIQSVKVESLRNWISTQQTHKLWLLTKMHRQLKFCYTANDSIKESGDTFMFLNNLDICFQNPVSRNVEIYIQKKKSYKLVFLRQKCFSRVVSVILRWNIPESQSSERFTIKPHLKCGYFSINITHLLYIQYTFKTTCPHKKEVLWEQTEWALCVLQKNNIKSLSTWTLAIFNNSSLSFLWILTWLK